MDLQGLVSEPGSLLCQPDCSTSHTVRATPGRTLKVASPLPSVSWLASPASRAALALASMKTVQPDRPGSPRSRSPSALRSSYLVTVMVAWSEVRRVGLGVSPDSSSAAGMVLQGLVSEPGSLLCQPDCSTSHTVRATPGRTLKVASPLPSVRWLASPASRAALAVASMKTVQPDRPGSPRSRSPSALRSSYLVTVMVA